MINARFVPITDWPGPQTPRYQQKNATFRASYVQTLDLLEDELAKLNATDILIQAYLTRDQIRNDGWPRGNAIPEPAGIILTFEVARNGKRLSMSFPCDTFNDWQDNLRAIAKSLEALRMVDRYGVTRNNEQYRGFTAIGAGDPRAAALAFLAKMTGWPEAQIASDPNGAYRLAAAALHPDQGGTHEGFVALARHMEALR